MQRATRAEDKSDQVEVNNSLTVYFKLQIPDEPTNGSFQS